MKRIHLLALLLILIASTAPAAEIIRRNVSWTTEGQNDPIVQITNESEEGRILTLRLLIDTSSYRYASDLDVPSGENRFVRIKEILTSLMGRYPELEGITSGLLQLEYEGVSDDIKTQLVNLNPKSGIISDRGTDRGTPKILSVDPGSGSPDGGAIVTILGENFDDSTAVRFGGVTALRNRQSNEVILAVSPKHIPGEVDVEVSNGKKSARLSKAFRYEWENPVITQLDPDSGPVRGGTKVLIQGRNFQAGAAVRWNETQLPVRFVSAQSLSVLSPEGKDGPVSVEVINPDGKTFVLPNAFEYQGLPEITSVNPRSGNLSGGMMVTVIGANFEEGAGVLFGDQYGQTTFINSKTLAAQVPPGESGFVNVTVSNPGGETATLTSAFLYNEPPRIVHIEAVPNPVVRNTTSAIKVRAVDSEISPLQFEYRVAQGPPGCYISGQGDEATFFSGSSIGTSIVQVIVYDEHQAKTSGTIEIQIE